MREMRSARRERGIQGPRYWGSEDAGRGCRSAWRRRERELYFSPYISRKQCPLLMKIPRVGRSERPTPFCLRSVRVNVPEIPKIREKRHSPLLECVSSCCLSQRSLSEKDESHGAPRTDADRPRQWLSLSSSLCGIFGLSTCFKGFSGMKRGIYVF